MRNFHQHGIDTRGRISGRIKTICPQCNDTRGHKGNKSLSVDLDKGLCYCHHCGYKFYVPDDAEERLEAATPRHAPKTRRTAPALPPPRLRPCPDATFRESGTLLDHRTLPASGTAARPAHHRRNGAPARNRPRRELHLLQLLRERDTRQHQVPQRPEALHDGEGSRAHPLQRRQHPGHPGVYHHRRRVRRGSRHRCRTQGRRLRARRRPEQPHVAGPLRRVALRRQAGHLHRRRRGPCRAVAPAGTHASPRSGTLPHRALRRGLQGCQRTPGEIRCRKPPHLHRAGRRSPPSKASSPPKTAATTCAPSTRTACNAVPTPVGTTSTSTAPSNLAACWSSPDAPATASPEFTDELVLRLCLRHEWKIAFFSPENMPIAYHLHKLAEKLTGHRFTPGPGMTEAVYEQAVGWLDRNVSHILPDDGSYGIDHILEKARQVVRRKGVRILIIDPMNRLEQHLEPGQTEMAYITDTPEQAGTFRHPQPVPRHPRGPSPQGEPQRKGRHPAPCRDERHQRLCQLRQHVRLLSRGRPQRHQADGHRLHRESPLQASGQRTHRCQVRLQPPERPLLALRGSLYPHPPKGTDQDR